MTDSIYDHADYLYAAGYIICKPSYRLLVPATAHDILEDISALLDYLSSPAYRATWPPGVTVDLNNILVLGSSAGGYLARQTAIRMTEMAKRPSPTKPRMTLRGLVVYFGMAGQLLHSRWLKATRDESSSTHSEPWHELEDLRKAGEISDVGYTLGLQGWEYTARRVALWDWFTQHSLLLDVMAGTDGRIKRALNSTDSSLSESERLLSAIPEQHLPLFPQLWFDNPENCLRLPPCFFIHGTSDDDVPLDETLFTVAQLKKAGKPASERTLHLVDGADHELWIKGTKELAPDVARVHGELIAFIRACCA